nr:thiamine-phosphate kinase [Sphingomicrobium sp. B8]
MIARIRRKADHPAARGLRDDVARLGDLVMTHDTIAQSVHYRADDPPESVGWKLVAVNLSDLAAKGADPQAALLSLAIGDPTKDLAAGEWEERFLTGVEAACESYGLPLVGGDTIALPKGAPRVLGLTAIGRAETAPSRSGAQAGDTIWLVGTLGDAMAGLALLEEDEDAAGTLVEAYRRPVPQLAAGRALAPYAHAMMDVSDGLLLDAQRMAEASGVAMVIDLGALPLSDAFTATRGDDQLFAATGGDDYALLLTASPFDARNVTTCLPSGTIMTAIGRVEEGAGLRLHDSNGPVELPERLGHEHRSP